MRSRRLAAPLLFAGLSLSAFTGTAGAAETEGPAAIPHQSEECIHILEGGGLPADCHEAPSPILPATNEIIWGAISFTILLIAMWKLALPGVKKSMDARTERIRGDLDEAERTKAEAFQVLDDYQRQLNDAKAEAGRIIDEARQTAEQMRRDLMARAETEVQELRERNRSDIAAASDRAFADLQSRVGDLAIGLAETIVESNLDRDAQNRLIESYINQVGTSS